MNVPQALSTIDCLSVVLSSYEVIRDLFAKDELSDRQCDGPGMDRNMNRNMGNWAALRKFYASNRFSDAKKG